MTVTWTTWVPVPSEVQYGLQPSGPLPFRARGTFSLFVDGGILRRKLYIHRVTLQGLLPGVQYGERCPGARVLKGEWEEEWDVGQQLLLAGGSGRLVPSLLTCKPIV